MAECSSTESGVVCANRRSIRRKLLEKEVESASKQSRTECETNNDEYSSAGATTAGAAQVTKQIPPQKKARSKGTKKSTTTNDEDSSVRATTTQAAQPRSNNPLKGKLEPARQREQKDQSLQAVKPQVLEQRPLEQPKPRSKKPIKRKPEPAKQRQ